MPGCQVGLRRLAPTYGKRLRIGGNDALYKSMYFTFLRVNASFQIFSRGWGGGKCPAGHLIDAVIAGEVFVCGLVCYGFFNVFFAMFVATSSSAVAKRPRDALWSSVVSFSSTVPRVQSFIIVTSASDLPLRTIKCCSAVFGVTLRLLVINTSSSSPVKNKRRRLPAMSVTNLSWSDAAVCIAPGGRTVHITRLSQILAENRDFCRAMLCKRSLCLCVCLTVCLCVCHVRAFCCNE